MTRIMRQLSRGGIGKQLVYLPNLLVFLKLLKEEKEMTGKVKEVFKALNLEVEL